MQSLPGYGVFLKKEELVDRKNAMYNQSYSESIYNKMNKQYSSSNQKEQNDSRKDTKINSNNFLFYDLKDDFNKISKENFNESYQSSLEKLYNSHKEKSQTQKTNPNKALQNLHDLANITKLQSESFDIELSKFPMNSLRGNSKAENGLVKSSTEPFLLNSKPYGLSDKFCQNKGYYGEKNWDGKYNINQSKSYRSTNDSEFLKPSSMQFYGMNNQNTGNLGKKVVSDLILGNNSYDAPKNLKPNGFMNQGKGHFGGLPSQKEMVMDSDWGMEKITSEIY